MDELQDAIEDAQYVNAIACVDEGPRPMLPWEFPNDEQLTTWKEIKNAELSKLIAEGRRTRRRTSYSKLNVTTRSGVSSSLVGTSSMTCGKSFAAAAAAVAAADEKEEELKKEEQQIDLKQAKDAKENKTPPGTTNPIVSDERAVAPLDTSTRSSTGKITFVDDQSVPKTLTTSLTEPGATTSSSPLRSTASRLKGTPLESYEYVCAQPLGFFLFAQFVKDEKHDYLRMNFVEDSVLYRRVRGSHHREHRAREIALTYLVDKSSAVRKEHDQFRRLSGFSAMYTEETPPHRDSRGLTVSVENAVQADETVIAQTGTPGNMSALNKKKSRRYLKNSSHASDELSILNMDKELVIQEPPADPVLSNIPQKKDIVEFDLARVEELSLRKLGHNDTDLQALLDKNLDLGEDSRSLIQVKMDGPALRRALKRCGIPYICPKNSAINHPQNDNKHPPVGSDSSKPSESISQENLESNKLETAPAKQIDEFVNDKPEVDPRTSDENAEDLSLPDSTTKAPTPKLTVSEATAVVPDELEELRVSGDRDLFDELELIVMEGLQRQYWKDFLQSNEYKKLLNFWWYRDRKVIEDDFFLMRVLGRGGFGLVHACKKGTSGKLFAMKVMNKKRIKLKKSEQLTVNERMALAAVDSPFVVKLSYAFQSKDDIFLILDLMTGGDLGFHLHQKGKFSKRECLYFSARIMLGLQAIHDRRFVYRDLKPENVLVGDDGRVKLSDLGLATKITPTLHGAAGTRGYWAPEMLRRDHKGRRKAYGHTVDWFSFGCCLYEFISGFNPFRSQDALRFGMKEGMDSKEKALDCATLKMEPSFDPARFDHDAAELCSRLLDKNEKTRLGAKGCQEIMAHPYYRDMNWEAIISDRMKPPFIPPKDVNAASQSEIGTFAEDRTYHETQLEAEDEEVYKYWDWTNPIAYDAEVIEFLIHERRTGKPLVPSDPMTPCCCVLL